MFEYTLVAIDYIIYKSALDIFLTASISLTLSEIFVYEYSFPCDQLTQMSYSLK